MKKEKMLIRRYFRTPLLYKSLPVLAVLLLVLSLYMISNGFSNEVSKKDLPDYVSYNGSYLRAGEKAYLDITGISDPIKERDGMHYYITLDEGTGEEQWYYYLVLLDQVTFNKLGVQNRFYYNVTEEIVPYRLYGTVITPSDSFVDEICEMYNFEYQDYYETFGDTYLAVNSTNFTKGTIWLLVLITSFIGLVASLILIIGFRSRISKMIKSLESSGLLELAASELGNAPASGDDPMFTESFLFNRKTATAAYLPDILMISKVNNIREHILAGYMRQGVYVALAGRDASKYQDIIEHIQQVNPDLMLEYNHDNFLRYSEMVNDYMQNKDRQQN